MGMGSLATTRYDVRLNCYDIVTPQDPDLIRRCNDVLYPCGLGVYHSGVEVHGQEWAYGGHPDPISGIFSVEPRKCAGVRYRTSVHLGTTSVGPDGVLGIVDRMGRCAFLGTRYALLTHNCNTFAHALAKELGVANKYPTWTNRLAHIASNCHCLIPEGVDQPLGEAAPRLEAVEEPRKPPPVATFNTICTTSASTTVNSTAIATTSTRTPARVTATATVQRQPTLTAM